MGKGEKPENSKVCASNNKQVKVPKRIINILLKKRKLGRAQEAS